MKLCLVFLFAIQAFHLLNAESDVDKCGKRSPEFSKDRVTGGRDAQINEFPWMASMQLKRINRWGHFCGAAILNKRYLLSAAHCFNDFPLSSSLNELRVVTNVIDLKDTENQKIWQVEKIIKHPNHNPTSRENDIALVKLKQDIQPFTYTQKPICLPAQNERVTDKVAIAGWGWVTEGGQTKSTLQTVTIDVKSKDYCAQRIGKDRFISRVMICAGGQDEKDSCKGDSGSPLVKFLNNEGVAFGVVSFGMGCGRIGNPGVYAKVSRYVDWINDIIN